MSYNPLEDPDLTGDIYADVDPVLHPVFTQKSDVFSPPGGWTTYGFHGFVNPDWSGGAISTTVKRKYNFLIPRYRWGGIRTVPPTALVGFPSGGESLHQSRLMGAGIMFAESAFVRTVNGEILHRNEPGNYPSLFNGKFDNSSEYFPQFEGQKFSRRYCFLVWCLVPRVRYRLYWTKGEYFTAYDPFYPENPASATTYYTEFTATKHYKWLFLNPEPTEYPFDETGNLVYDVANASRSGTLWNGTENDHGSHSFTDAQGADICHDCALGPYTRSYFPVEPVDYAGPSGQYSGAVHGTYVSCE